MTIGNTRRCRLGVLILAFMALQIVPLQAAQPGVKQASIQVTALDFDACEPVQIRSKIMEVGGDHGTIVVAEREIREMNVETGGRRIKTVFLNPEGRPESPETFRAGQYVLVKGFLHPDGYVAASQVQRIEKPREYQTTLKPVTFPGKALRKATRPSAPPHAGQ